MDKLEIIGKWNLLGKIFAIYGTSETPLFLAKEVATMIEHSNPRMMLQMVGADEKQCVNNPYALKGQQEQWFLTEDGLYEVLMQSRKPIAKQFKTKVKEILKEIRKTGSYAIKQERQTKINAEYSPVTLKYYNGQGVITKRDIAQILRVPEPKIGYLLHAPKCGCVEKLDYVLLKGTAIREFIRQNKSLSKIISTLLVVTESGFRKICKCLKMASSFIGFPKLGQQTPLVPVTPMPPKSITEIGMYADPSSNPEIKGWIDDIRAHMDALDLLLHRYTEKKLYKAQDGLKYVLRDISTEIACSVRQLTKEKFETTNQYT